MFKSYIYYSKYIYNYNYILIFWLSIYRAHAHLKTLKVLKYKSIKV